jgi:hypothetical protein
MVRQADEPPLYGFAPDQVAGARVSRWLRVYRNSAHLSRWSDGVAPASSLRARQEPCAHLLLSDVIQESRRR